MTKEKPLSVLVRNQIVKQKFKQLQKDIYFARNRIEGKASQTETLIWLLEHHDEIK